MDSREEALWSEKGLWREELDQGGLTQESFLLGSEDLLSQGLHEAGQSGVDCRIDPSRQLICHDPANPQSFPPMCSTNPPGDSSRNGESRAGLASLGL